MRKKQKWFTLVELIIVIIILIILATIAFISLWDYTMQTRDSKRISDLKNIEKAIEIYKVKNWNYPTPEYNGNFSKEFLEILPELTNLPKDPNWVNYSYKIKNWKPILWACFETKVPETMEQNKNCGEKNISDIKINPKLYEIEKEILENKDEIFYFEVKNDNIFIIYQDKESFELERAWILSDYKEKRYFYMVKNGEKIWENFHSKMWPVGEIDDKWDFFARISNDGGYNWEIIKNWKKLDENISFNINDKEYFKTELQVETRQDWIYKNWEKIIETEKESRILNIIWDDIYYTLDENDDDAIFSYKKITKKLFKNNEEINFKIDKKIYINNIIFAKDKKIIFSFTDKNWEYYNYMDWKIFINISLKLPTNWEFFYDTFYQNNIINFPDDYINWIPNYFFYKVKKNWFFVESIWDNIEENTSDFENNLIIDLKDKDFLNQWFYTNTSIDSKCNIYTHFDIPTGFAWNAVIQNRFILKNWKPLEESLWEEIGC